MVLAAAIQEGHQGPVFLQGDHFQANPKKYAADPEGEIEAIRKLTREAIDAGFYNIDIDTSTLVDLSQPTVREQQRVNFSRGAELTALIRRLEPTGVTVSVGGEIGEVGKKNTTVEEFRAYMDGSRRGARQARAGAEGHQQDQRPDRHHPRRRAAARRERRRGHASTSTCCATISQVASTITAWPAASSTAPRPCPRRRSTASPRPAPPRSTSPPGSRT